MNKITSLQTGGNCDIRSRDILSLKDSERASALCESTRVAHQQKTLDMLVVLFVWDVNYVPNAAA